MSKIKLKETEKDIKLSEKSSVITSGRKAAYIKTKVKSENLTEDNQQNSEEYANQMLENMASDTSNTAQELAKHKFKQSVQKNRAVNAQQNKTVITNTAVSMESNAQYGRINTAQDRAKQRVVKNSIRAKVAGATTFKEKVVEFIKGGSAAALNTAKIAIANTKILTATLLAMGGVAILFTIVICTIGLVMGSSFGIFMATEDTRTGYTLTSVVQEINEEYIAEIEKIKTDVPHDDFEITEEIPNWKDILAIYAVKATTDFDGVEVVTVDEQKAELIRNVFWNMTELTYETEPYEETETVEITDVEGNTTEQEITVTKIRLIISTKNKTAAEAAVLYNFNNVQINQLNELISNANDGLWEIIENINDKYMIKRLVK